jgi:hypothetical protein
MLEKLLGEIRYRDANQHAHHPFNQQQFRFEGGGEFFFELEVEYALVTSSPWEAETTRTTAPIAMLIRRTALRSWRRK